MSKNVSVTSTFGRKRHVYTNFRYSRMDPSIRGGHTERAGNMSKFLMKQAKQRWEFIKENKKVRKQELDQESDQEKKTLFFS